MPRKKFPANVVGPAVRKARCRLGLSQEELAARCQRAGLDISRSTLAQIEIQYRYLSDDELLILAAVLNLSTDDLYPEEIKRRYRNKRHTRLK
jgi:transcriptional regulator with XRE-family HTH domain